MSESSIIAADIQSFAVPADIDVDKPPSFSQSRDYVFLAAIAALISISSLIFYYRQNAILLYGDAVAHINIARRVFDSRTPGFFNSAQSGCRCPICWTSHSSSMTSCGGQDRCFDSVDAGLRCGHAGNFPAGTRLCRQERSRRTAAWVAALIFAFNPNIIYMQSTAMTEPLYLALMIWALVYFADFVRLAKTMGIVRAWRWKNARCLWLRTCWSAMTDGFSPQLWASPQLHVLSWSNRIGERQIRRALIEFVLLACPWADCGWRTTRPIMGIRWSGRTDRICQGDSGTFADGHVSELSGRKFRSHCGALFFESFAAEHGRGEQ